MIESRFDSIAGLVDKQSGAARMTILLALWSLALVVLHDVRVDAATVREVAAPSSNWLAAPAPSPRIDSAQLWNALAEHSDVMSGRWTRQSKAATHRTTRAHRTASASRAPQPPVVPPVREADVKVTSAVAQTEQRVAGLIAERRFDAAAASIDAARSSDADTNVRLRLLDARVAIARGDFERACSQLLANLPDVRISTEQHDLLAVAMLRTGRFAESAAVYRALLSVDSHNPRWWAGYAVALNELGRRADSVAAYRALQSLAPPGSALSSWATQQLERMT
jgi:tetratricopeptide (TPR) repeat protein